MQGPLSVLMEGLVRCFIQVVPIGSEEIEYHRVLQYSLGLKQFFCLFNDSIGPEYDLTIPRQTFARYLNFPLVVVSNFFPEALPGWLA